MTAIVARKFDQVSPVLNTPGMLRSHSPWRRLPPRDRLGLVVQLVVFKPVTVSLQKSRVFHATRFRFVRHRGPRSPRPRATCAASRPRPPIRSTCARAERADSTAGIQDRACSACAPRAGTRGTIAACWRTLHMPCGHIRTRQRARRPCTRCTAPSSAHVRGLQCAWRARRL